MTKCYEFYAPIARLIKEGKATADIRTDLPYCKDKCARSLQYSVKYIKLLLEKGVNFDYSEQDKELFRKLKEELGSEQTRLREKKTNNYSPKKKKNLTWKNQLACPHCNKLIIVQKVGDRYKVEKSSKKNEPNYLTIDPML